MRRRGDVVVTRSSVTACFHKVTNGLIAFWRDRRAGTGRGRRGGGGGVRVLPGRALARAPAPARAGVDDRPRAVRGRGGGASGPGRPRAGWVGVSRPLPLLRPCPR